MSKTNKPTLDEILLKVFVKHAYLQPEDRVWLSEPKIVEAKADLLAHLEAICDEVIGDNSLTPETAKNLARTSPLAYNRLSAKDTLRAEQHARLSEILKREQ